MMINAANIYSVLGSQNSLVPLLVKDAFASTGMTVGSYVTGKEEGKDRLIDEVGTEAVWLGSVPLYRCLFDKTAFRIAGLDSKFDARNLKNKEIFKRTIKYAPTEEIRNSIEKIENKQSLFKKLAASKFLVSTTLAIASYVALTKLKQKYTENQIKKHLIEEYNEKKKKQSDKQEKCDKTEDIVSPSFKSLGTMAENLAYNSVKNMWIVDGSITLERLLDSRSPQEFIGYAIKEAFSLCFLYYAGGKVQELLENRAQKKYNRNIALDSRILENNYLKNVFTDKSIEKSFAAFDKLKTATNGTKDAVELFDFLHNNPDNAIVKMAKQSKIIKSYKNTNKIDTRAYIDFGQVEEMTNNLKKLYKQYTDSLNKGESSEKFFASLKKLKRGSIITNIGVCIFALGVLAPATMLIKRKFFDKDDEFQTKKEVREQLIKEGVII